MTAAYAWIIDRDHIADRDQREGTHANARGVQGPHDAPDELLALLGEPRKVGDHSATPANVRRFRLYDDDGELYYSGRQAFIDADDADEEAEFGPLDDFGGPNAGAVRLDYWDAATAEWRTL